MRIDKEDTKKAVSILTLYEDIARSLFNIRNNQRLKGQDITYLYLGYPLIVVNQFSYLAIHAGTEIHGRG